MVRVRLPDGSVELLRGPYDREVRARYSRRLSASGTPWATLPAIRLGSPPRRKRTTRSASSSDGMFSGEVFEVATARSRARESSRSDAAYPDPQVVWSRSADRLTIEREKGFEPLPAQAEIVNHLAILQ